MNGINICRKTPVNSLPVTKHDGTSIYIYTYITVIYLDRQYDKIFQTLWFNGPLVRLTFHDLIYLIQCPGLYTYNTPTHIFPSLNCVVIFLFSLITRAKITAYR